METLDRLLSTLANFVWGVPMLVLLVGTGLYLTIVLRGVQFRALGHAFRLIFHKESSAAGDISHFAALTTALASTVGIGNIVGVATAITLGGPGAVFWMWVTGLVGMATKYAEAVLAVKYREPGVLGYKGGPMYYLTNGLGLRWLGVLFAVFTVIASFGIGNMTQVNAVSQLLASTAGIPTWVSGGVMLFLTALVILGGVKSIGRFTAWLVPFMIFFYCLATIVVLVLQWDRLLPALESIFYYAFHPHAAAGGFAGATVAADLTMRSFAHNLGSVGAWVVIIATVLFAYSTVIGWSYYGEKAFEFLFGHKAIRIYRTVFVAVILVGATVKLELVWNFSDVANGLMAVPNLVALLLLARVVKAETERYFGRKGGPS
jgi:Na+/alanine symporter